MKLSRQEVEHVAELARLRLEPEQVDRLTGQLNQILGYMDKLNQLDTSEIPSTSHALELTGAWREDEVRPSLDREKGLANAPESDGQSFVVPRII